MGQYNVIMWFFNAVEWIRLVLLTMQKEQKNFIVNVKIYIDYVNGPRSIFKGSFWILFQLNGMYLLDKSIKMLPTSYPSEPPGEQEEV